MYKLIDSSSFFNLEEPQVTVINTENISGLTKQAVDSRVSSYVERLDPKADKLYLHINAMGAGEFYGSNKNGDWFPEENLKEYYKTFETSPAHVFRHHINKDPAKAIGRVLFAIYNERMHRVELVAEVDRNLGRDIEERIAAGDYPSTSMACKTPYDVCSICGNKAHTRQEYCQHLTGSLGQLAPTGKRVMALNVGPLKFFDISIVIRPADVTSSILQKVAEHSAVSSAELAEAEDLSEVSKQASFTKLSDIIKEIEEGYVDGASPELEKIITNTKELNEALIPQLRVFNLSDTLSAMAELGISPSLEFLSELIARKTLGEEGKGLGKIAADYVRTIESDTTQVPNIKFEKPSYINHLVLKLLSPHAENSSLLPEFVEKRASRGYASFNPNGYEEPTATKPMVESPHVVLAPLAKTLLAIGGAAILAKMYISNLIKEKLQERNNNYNAKIVIVKQASDYVLAYRLAKYATAKDLDRKNKKKNLDRLATGTRQLLSASETRLGGKLSKVIKTVQLGSKVVDKYKGNKT